ncbi:MAG: hypothetical protein R3E77_05320 [Steroidobacteraceae bacterium]
MAANRTVSLSLIGLLLTPAFTNASEASICASAVQGQVPWNYSGNVRWQEQNIERLCAGAKDSTEPARCFKTVMHAGVKHAQGDRWRWQDALELCAGTLDHQASIDCFEKRIAAGLDNTAARSACLWNQPAPPLSQVAPAELQPQSMQRPVDDRAMTNSRAVPQSRASDVMQAEIVLPTIVSRLMFRFITGEDDARQSSIVYVAVIGKNGEFLTGHRSQSGELGGPGKYGVRTDSAWERAKEGGYPDTQVREYATWSKGEWSDVTINLRRPVPIDEIREVMIHLQQNLCLGCTSDNWDMKSVAVYAEVDGKVQSSALFRTPGARPYQFSESWPILLLRRAEGNEASVTEWRENR